MIIPRTLDDMTSYLLSDFPKAILNALFLRVIGNKPRRRVDPFGSDSPCHGIIFLKSGIPTHSTPLGVKGESTGGNHPYRAMAETSEHPRRIRTNMVQIFDVALWSWDQASIFVNHTDSRTRGASRGHTVVYSSVPTKGLWDGVEIRNTIG